MQKLVSQSQRSIRAKPLVTSHSGRLRCWTRWRRGEGRGEEKEEKRRREGGEETREGDEEKGRKNVGGIHRNMEDRWIGRTKYGKKKTQRERGRRKRRGKDISRKGGGGEGETYTCWAGEAKIGMRGESRGWAGVGVEGGSACLCVEEELKISQYGKQSLNRKKYHCNT